MDKVEGKAKEAYGAIIGAEAKRQRVAPSRERPKPMGQARSGKE